MNNKEYFKILIKYINDIIKTVNNSNKDLLIKYYYDILKQINNNTEVIMVTGGINKLKDLILKCENNNNKDLIKKSIKLIIEIETKFKTKKLNPLDLCKDLSDNLDDLSKYRLLLLNKYNDKNIDLNSKKIIEESLDYCESKLMEHDINLIKNYIDSKSDFEKLNYKNYLIDLLKSNNEREYDKKLDRVGIEYIDSLNKK